MGMYQGRHAIIRAVRSLPRTAVAAIAVGAIAAAATGGVLIAGSAGASTAARISTPEQAGYAATNAQFQFVSANVYLRNPAQYASSLGSYGDSVQLWSDDMEITLGVSDTTSSGGGFSPAMAVFDHTKTAPDDVTCSTAGTTPCPGTPKNWTDGSVSYPKGDTVTLALEYNRGSGLVTAIIRDETAGKASQASYDVGTGVSFNQARVGAETGCYAPWDPASVNGCGSTVTPPSAPQLLSRFTGVTLVTYSGHVSGMASWWQHHKVLLTADGTATQPTQAAPANLGSGGTSFSVSLLPAS
ncbi:MAG: hypothetical protein J2P35_21445 [Actinobacteria bacterium]|nr:hypothetical protein [Actinomycetota bacterium]MBO0786972.1 hypothetical protein [Actinomycetota bacterium]